jgi:hypothetical protein
VFVTRNCGFKIGKLYVGKITFCYKEKVKNLLGKRYVFSYGNNVNFRINGPSTVLRNKNIVCFVQILKKHDMSTISIIMENLCRLYK